MATVRSLSKSIMSRVVITDKKIHKERILFAETKANNWLARANELREAGKSDSKAMEQAQKWLDKLNDLEENYGRFLV